MSSAGEANRTRTRGSINLSHNNDANNVKVRRLASKSGSIIAVGAFSGPSINS